MKKLLLTLTMLLAVAGFARAEETSFTVEFKSGTGTSDSSSAFTTSTQLSNVIASGDEYLSGIASTYNVYQARTGLGLKFGSSSTAGNIVFDLSTTGKVKATKYVVSAAPYNSEATTLSINGTTAQNVSGTGMTLSNYTFTPTTPVDISQLSINTSGKRCFVASVTVYYDNDDTTNPGEGGDNGDDEGDGDNEGEESTDVTFDFKSRGIGNANDAGTQTEGPIDIIFSKGTGSNAPKYYDSGESVRLYAGSTFTVKSTTGANIIKIELSFGGTKNTISADKGNYTDVQKNQTGTWTGSATEIVFSNTGGQSYLQKVVVYYEGSGEPEDTRLDPQMKWSVDEFTAKIGDENISYPTFSSAFGRTAVHFNSSKDTVATIGLVNGVIELLSPGETVITAEFDGNDTYKPGSASYTLKVEPAETVTPDPTPGDGTKYTMVLSENELIDGEYYVIAAGALQNPVAMSTTNLSDKNSTSITVSDNSFVVEDDSDVMILQYKNGGLFTTNYTGTNGYLTWTTGSGGQKMSTSSSVVALSISIAEDGKATIKLGSNNDSGSIQYNSSGYFRAYTSNQSAVQLYKRTSAVAPALPAGTPTLTINGQPVEGESMIVSAGTQVTLDCENAVSWTGMVGDTDMEEQPVPYTFTVNETTEIMVAGLNANEEEGETLEFTFYVGEVDPGMPAVGSIFKQILNANHETELVENAYYVVGRYYTSGNNPVAAVMSTTYNSNNSTFSATTNVEFEDYEQRYYDAGNTRINSRTTSIMTMTGNDVLIVKLVKQDGQWGMRTVNLGNGFEDEQKFLTGGDGTAVVLTNEFAPVSIDFKTSNNVMIAFDNTPARLLSYSTTGGGSFNNLQTENPNVQLYKYTTAKKFEYPETEVKVKAGDTYTFEVDDPKPEITYRKKGNVVCFDVEGNVLTAKLINTADGGTVMAEWFDSDDWFGNLVEIPVTVRYSAELGFRHGTDPQNPVRGKKGVGVVWQAAYYTGDGTLTYSSSDPEAVKVDPLTGQINPLDIDGAKTDGTIYTITAHVEGESISFVEDDAVYYIKVEEPESGALGEPNPELAIKENFCGENGENINEEHWDIPFGNESYSTKESVHTSNTTGIKYTEYATSIWQTGKKYYLQINKGTGYISFSLPKNCVGITFTPGAGASTTAQASIYLDDQLLEEALTIYGNDVYYPFEGDQSGKKVTISAAKTNRTVMIAAITFNIAEPAGGDLPGLAFEGTVEGRERVINTFVGQTVSLPTLQHNKDFKWELFTPDDFDIDEINEMDEDESFRNYTIEPNDFDDISVTVFDPGVYTFRAKYDGDETFLSGMAILRLNVFPHLSVNPKDEDRLADDSRTDSPALTLAHPDVDGGEIATITLPSIASLQNDFKYSTIKVTKVVIRHGEEEITFETDNIDALPETYEFTKDGSVTYTIQYGNAEGFDAETTVHVILMPQVPTYTSSDLESTKVYEITPSQNAVLMYRTERKAVTVAAESADWTQAETTPATFTVPDDLNSSQYLSILFKSVKDISHLAEGEPLESEVGEIALYSGTTGVEDIIEGENGTDVYYNIQGVRVSEDNLAPGVYIRTNGSTVEKIYVK